MSVQALIFNISDYNEELRRRYEDNQLQEVFIHYVMACCTPFIMRGVGVNYYTGFVYGEPWLRIMQ